MTQMQTEVPIFDLPAQFEEEREELMEIVERVLASGAYVLAGDEVAALEEEVATFVGTDHAITVNSGTDALTIGLACLDIKPGDEVITPPNSFIASTGAIVHVGATPVFIDVCDDQNMDPEKLESLITPKTKAIMPVHLTGRICDMDPIVAIAEKHGLKIIEDAAQSMGSEYKGRKSGTFGDVGCFSCHPLKNMNACGDGGLITTNDSDIRDRAIRLRNHGMIDRNTALEFGFVSRMDNLQAAILRLRLRHLPDVVARRRRNVEQYRAEIDTDHVYIPPCLDHEFNTFVLFVAQLDRRDELQAYLAERGISTGIHYPVPIHLQPAARYLGHKAGDYPEVERQADRIISLPHNQNLSESQVSYVCEQINRFYMTG
ncbi:MAG: transcriptional regulator [Alphaproteobacteria bacterium]|nr:transcriptional regulator [Alphaproteobacteria bacterium]